MQIFLFFALIISVLAVIFAIQNNDPTTVSFAIWKYNGSLALVLLVAVAAGSLISFFVSLPSNLKTRWTIRQQRKKMTELESSLATAQRPARRSPENSSVRQTSPPNLRRRCPRRSSPSNGEPAPVKDPTVEA